jgi:hypothetical protein
MTVVFLVGSMAYGCKVAILFDVVNTKVSDLQEKVNKTCMDFAK